MSRDIAVGMEEDDSGWLAPLLDSPSRFFSSTVQTGRELKTRLQSWITSSFDENGQKNSDRDPRNGSNARRPCACLISRRRTLDRCRSSRVGQRRNERSPGERLRGAETTARNQQRNDATRSGQLRCQSGEYSEAQADRSDRGREEIE